MQTDWPDEELAGMSYAKASEAPASPSYNADIRAKLNDIMLISDDVVAVHIHEGPDARLEIKLRDRHNLSLRRETAERIGRLFGIPAVFVSETTPDWPRQPQHSYYRDDRRAPGEFVREHRKLPRR